MTSLWNIRGKLCRIILGSPNNMLRFAFCVISSFMEWQGYDTMKLEYDKDGKTESLIIKREKNGNENIVAWLIYGGFYWW